MHYFTYGDYVSAYMWFNLAAAQGNTFANMFLKDTADKMTPEQITEDRNSHESGSQTRSRLLVRDPRRLSYGPDNTYETLGSSVEDW